MNFQVHSKEKIEGSSEPSSGATIGIGGAYGYRRGYYGVWTGYPAETRVTQYTEGTLHVDLVDAGRKQLVWEGTIVGRIHEEARKDMPTAVNKAVAQVFSKYPYHAGSAEKIAPAKP